MAAALLALALALALPERMQCVLHPEEFPNLLAGSFTDGGKFSTGNTLPLVGMPWGFNHWAPQTRDRSRFTGSWWFSGSDHSFTWLRCTHQPSPWIGDWGYFHFTPQIGDLSHSPTHFWEPRGAHIKPYEFDATVAPFNIRIQLVPTNHAAMLRVTFPTSRDHGEKHICFASAHWTEQNTLSGGGQYIVGSANQVTSDRMLVSNFALRLRAESPEALSVDSAQDMKCFKYHREATVVHVKMATSLISPEQATLNLQRELLDKTYETVLAESKEVWGKLMRRVDVLDAGLESGQSSKDLIVFYTGLYRALTFPRRLDEIDQAGNVVHYSPYDRSGRVHAGPLVTDNGLWDTFRTVYPLLSLAYPDHLGNIVQGWLNAYREGEWLPSWASPGYRNCMVGTFADVVIADAIVKDIGCFDTKIAVDALIKDAYQEGPGFAGGAVAKEGLREYMSRGYLPLEVGGEVVSRTLDYGFADYSTSQAFIHLEKTSAELDRKTKDDLHLKAEELQRRAMRAVSSLFDAGRGLMVPKDRGGHFSSRFNAIQWGAGYTEGSPWHHSFPPYAVSCAVQDNLDRGNLREENPLNCQGGLTALFGGKERLLKKLHELLDTPSRFEVGTYNQEIHEMTEMRAFAMGQYGHNNQPAHHILYLFALLGEPQTTQRAVREVMDKGYGVDFYAGDEDNGEMGAWFVLSALGIFSTTPGSPYYVLGSPIFPHVRIHHTKEEFAGVGCAQKDAKRVPPAARGHLDIFAVQTARGKVLVDRVKVNGVEATGPMIHNSLLMSDGILEFVMEGDSENRDSRLHALHKQPTAALEKGASTGPLAPAIAEPAATADEAHEDLGTRLHEQQELIDQLQAELSKEKALASHQDSTASRLSEPPSSLQSLVDSVCYLGLLCVAILTIVFMFHAVVSLFSADGQDGRWRCVGSDLSGKPSAYTV